jgi:membrane associated rhomboid family serine protease
MFQGTQSVKFLFYTNLLIFAITLILAALNINILGPFVLWSYNSDLFFIHQLVTYQFLHGGLLHLIFNMLALVSILPIVEDYLDSKKFLMYYLICGIFAGLFNTFITGSNIPMVGASGSIWGMVVMFAILYPNTKLNFMFIPYGIKAKWLIGVMAIIELILGINQVNDGIGHLAHIGGGLMGLFLFTYEKYIVKNPN